MGSHIWWWQKEFLIADQKVKLQLKLPWAHSDTRQHLSTSIPFYIVYSRGIGKQLPAPWWLKLLPSCWRMLSPSCSPCGSLSYPTWPIRLWLSSSWAWTWVCDRRNDSPWALAPGSHRAPGKPSESPCRWKPGRICRREREPGSPSRFYSPPCLTRGSCPGGQLCSSSLPDFQGLFHWATFTSGLPALLT